MNDYTMASFHTEPGKVWYAGIHLLPTVADQYADMSRKVWMTRDTADDAFQGGSVTGRLTAVYETWNELRTELQNILATTSTNVKTAGDALVGFAEGVSGTDHAAGEEIGAASAAIDDLRVSVDAAVPGDTADPDLTHTHEEGSHRPGETGL